MSGPAIDLRAIRLNRGLGPAAAAEAIGVPKSVLTRAETGQTIPHPKNAIKIASFYGYKVTDIWAIGTEAAAA